mgnify:FL=1
MNNQALVLGCGHSESLEHYNSNCLVVNDAGKLLIDCGHTIKHALHAQGLGIADLDAIFVTHVHGDHVFGLERVAYESLFQHGRKIELIFHASLYDELWHQTLKGSLGSHSEGSARLEDYFSVTLLHEPSFERFGNNFTLLPARHTPRKPAFALNINQKFFHSGDSLAIPEIVLAQQIEVGFHDVSLSEDSPVHATLASLLEHYPRPVRKKLYLTSFEDHWREHQAVVEEEFAGFCRQGMVVEF